MGTVTVRGASDDLIEIEGDIREEFSHYALDENDKGVLLAFSDGTVLRARYDKDGLWRFHRLVSGSVKFTKVEGDVAADRNDVVTLKGDVRWVVKGNEIARKGGAG